MTTDIEWLARLFHRHQWVGLLMCLKCDKPTPQCRTTHRQEGRCAGRRGHPWEHAGVEVQAMFRRSSYAGVEIDGEWFVRGCRAFPEMAPV